MQYTLLKLLSRVICLLPYSFVLVMGKWMGKLYYHIAAHQRKLAVAQMQESLNIPVQAAERIVHSMFIKLGQTFLEVMYMPTLTQEKIAQYIHIENLPYLQDALAEGHGVVLLTAHIGNWEWLGASLARAGLPLTTIIKRQPNDQHTRILNEYREMVGIEVFARGTTELVGAAKALKKGKILGFLADQDAGPDGVFIEFLGKMAATPLGPAVFAKRFKAPVVPVFIVRRPGGHKVIVNKPLYYQDTGNEKQDLYDLTEKMTRIIEATIKEYPDEWMWFQKRWNTKFRPGAVNSDNQEAAATAGEAR